MNAQSIPIFKNGYRFQWEPVQDCHVLLYPEGMVKLNGPAGEILGLVGESKTLEKIIIQLQEKYPGAESIDQDVMSFIEEAIGNNWITIN